MTQYKLVYFNLKGRGEAIRILFEVANQQYDDHRVEFSEWASLKSKQVFSQLPVLEVTENGKTTAIAQSHTIERFLAKRFGLDGKTEMEKAQCDMVVEQIRDILDALIFMYRKPSSDEKKADIESFFKDEVRGFPAKFTDLQNFLEANKEGNGYLVGNSLTYADIILVVVYDWLFARRASILDKYPLMKQHEEKIKSLPKIGEHLKKYANDQLTILKPE